MFYRYAFLLFEPSAIFVCHLLATMMLNFQPTEFTNASAIKRRRKDVVIVVFFQKFAI